MQASACYRVFYKTRVSQTQSAYAEIIDMGGSL